MTPKMERPFKEGLLVRFPPSMAGKTEAQTEKNNKEQVCGKTGTHIMDSSLGTL